MKCGLGYIKFLSGFANADRKTLSLAFLNTRYGLGDEIAGDIGELAASSLGPV